MSAPGVFFDELFFGGLIYGGEHTQGTSNFYEVQQNAFKDLLQKYPDLDNFSLYNFDALGFSYYANMQGFDDVDVTFSVVFARRDWFPEPVFVYLESIDGNSYDSKTYIYDWSSKPLTDEQKKLIEGMASNPMASWFRRSHIIIPYDYMYSFGDNRPVKLALKEDAEGFKNPEFRISFDFLQLLTNETYENAISGGSWSQAQNGPNPAFTFRSDAGIPFGLKVNIVERN
jgi:hypothetical protein